MCFPEEFSQPSFVFELQSDPAVCECELFGKKIDRVVDLSVLQLRHDSQNQLFRSSPFDCNLAHINFLSCSVVSTGTGFDSKQPSGDLNDRFPSRLLKKISTFFVTNCDPMISRKFVDNPLSTKAAETAVLLASKWPSGSIVERTVV